MSMSAQFHYGMAIRELLCFCLHAFTGEISWKFLVVHEEKHEAKNLSHLFQTVIAASPVNLCDPLNSHPFYPFWGSCEK